ncbi:hypothetical protein MKW92_016077 [Papaver armeniacum]|nr:hypothetical protein MKW92_016077 [Papaver armeniacum]
MPTEDIYPDQAPTQGSELTGIVEAVPEVTHSSATKGDKFLGPGRLYEKGVLCKEVVLDEKFQEVGGFSVLKTQASLYEEIWLNYGHIASNQVLTDLYYYSQVVAVSEIMTSIVDMNRYHLEQVSSEMIDSWETKIEVAEKLEFNIGWLRERLEDIKKKIAEEKKLQDTLREQVQTKAQVIEAEQQFILAKEQLLALETKVSPLLMERQNLIDKCSGGLLLLIIESADRVELVSCHGSSGEGCNYDRRTYSMMVPCTNRFRNCMKNLKNRRMIDSSNPPQHRVLLYL